MAEVELIVGQIAPLIGAAVKAYGADVLTRIENTAADGTVARGQRALHSLLRRAPRREPLENAIADLAADLDDADALASVRLQIRRILAIDPALAAELAGLLPPIATALAVGARSVALGGDNRGPITTGDSSPIGERG